MSQTAPPSAESLAASAKAASRSGGAAPVHLWNPPFCGDLDMRIARDGTWSYLGTPIGRKALVRLFSSILKREGERYFLVTPVEKVGITVEDMPLHAVDVTVEGLGEAQNLTFITSTDDSVTAGPDHPIHLEHDLSTGEPAPSVLIRANLWARIDRKTFLRLAELGCHAPHDGDSWFGLWSAGRFFPMIPSSDLN